MAIDRDKIAFVSPLHPTDKVVEYFEGSFSLGANSATTQTISHSQSEKCLPLMMYSIDATNYYPAGASIYTSSTTETIATVDCGASDIHIYADNIGGATTISYKVFLIWPM